MQKFPYQFHKMQDQTLAYETLSIHKQEKKSPRGAHHLAQQFIKRYHQKSFAQERDTKISQVGWKFQPLVFSQWESYNKNEMKLDGGCMHLYSSQGFNQQ